MVLQRCKGYKPIPAPVSISANNRRFEEVTQRRKRKEDVNEVGEEAESD
jgi:hypothetical protein